MSTPNLVHVVAVLLAGVVLEAHADCQIVGNERQCNDPLGNQAWTTHVGADVFSNNSGEFPAAPRLRIPVATTFGTGDFPVAGQIGSQDFKTFTGGTLPANE